MRHVFITIPTTLVSMLLLAPVVRGQCGNVTVYATNYIERQTGNDVFAYAESEIAGQDYLQWILTLETWHYYNSTLDYYEKDVSPMGGAGVWRAYTSHLQSGGPGTLTINSLHKADNYGCNMHGPPYSSGWNGYMSHYLTVQRPTISSSNAPMYLGGAVASGNQSALSVLTANPNGAPASSTAAWSFLAGSTYGTVSCILSDCRSANYTAVKQASTCGAYDVQVAVSFDGFYSDTFPIFNNAPTAVQQMWGSPWDSVDVPNPPFPPGWETTYGYKVVDMCGGPVNFIEVTETLSGWSWPNGDNWGNWSPGQWTQPSQFNQWGDFVDYLSEKNQQGTNRAVWPAGQNALNEGGSSIGTALSQWFYGGSPTNGQGLPLGGLWSMTHYLDHGKSVQ